MSEVFSIEEHMKAVYQAENVGAYRERERILELLEGIVNMCTEAPLLEVAIHEIKGKTYDIYGYNWIHQKVKDAGLSITDDTPDEEVSDV